MMWEFSLIGYNSYWRRCRRTFHEFFHSGVVSEYRPFHIRAVKVLLSRLLETPEDFRGHFRRYAV